jgi:hypothetical protein
MPFCVTRRKPNHTGRTEGGKLSRTLPLVWLLCSDIAELHVLS